jgi:glyoxylase I family protein
MPNFSGVHHVNFTVTDIDRSTAWYCNVLGLSVGWNMDQEGVWRKVALVQPDSSFRMVLTQHASGNSDEFSELQTGLDHIAFTVADREELQGWRQRFEELGVDHSKIKEGATGFLITFRDPDNIQLEVYTQGK